MSPCFLKFRRWLGSRCDFIPRLNRKKQTGWSCSAKDEYSSIYLPVENLTVRQIVFDKNSSSLRRFSKEHALTREQRGFSSCRRKHAIFFTNNNNDAHLHER
jgi:hypothetical protein